MTIPNILTLLRVLLVPVIVMLLINEEKNILLWWAFGLFLVSAITDFLDGWLARKLDQESDFGRLIDPIADKLLIVGVYFALVENGTITDLHVIAFILIVCREVLVSALREYLAKFSINMSPTKLAKLKTAIQLVTSAALIISPLFSDTFLLFSLIGLWLSVVITISTGYSYCLYATKQISFKNKFRK